MSAVEMGTQLVLLPEIEEVDGILISEPARKHSLAYVYLWRPYCWAYLSLVLACAGIMAASSGGLGALVGCVIGIILCPAIPFLHAVSRMPRWAQIGIILLIPVVALVIHFWFFFLLLALLRGDTGGFIFGFLLGEVLEHRNS